MSDAGPSGAGTQGTTLRLLHERSRLSRLHGRIEPRALATWIELCDADGLGDEAWLLRRVALLHAGFSRQTLLEAGLGEAEPSGDALPGAAAGRAPRAASTVGIAQDELAGLARSIGTASEKVDAVATLLPAGCDMGGTARERIEPGAIAGFAGPVGALTDALRRPPGGTSAGIGELLARLLSLANGAPDFDLRGFAGAPLPLLAAAIAFASLQDFLWRHRDLFVAPTGSVALFHHAARFDSAGLGPWFGNVSRITRTSRDLFELAGLAANAAGEGGDATVDEDARLAPWLARLTRQCGTGLLLEVVDDLGDNGMTCSLRAILDRLVGVPHARVDSSMVMRIRDAAIDVADYALASRAQALIVDIHPDRAIEWEILATIDANDGRTASAERSLRHCQALDPGNPHLAPKLRALCEGRMEPFLIAHGYGSPEDRRLTRLRRRSGHQVVRVAPRTSSLAVQVNY